MPRPVGRGDFVTTSTPFQIGKIVGCEGGVAHVELFHSTLKPRQLVNVPVKDLRRGFVSDHTRVYIYNKASGSWVIGRVLRRGGETAKGVSYLVSLPNRPTGAVFTEQALYVRCASAEADPVEILATAEGLESQFFHDRRLAAQRAFVRLRAGAQGLTGLLSAAIDVLPHQVHVARRILQDPIQRYLLADEVGLGKTVEAGIVIRQFLLDTASGVVTVLAPQELVRQWEQELQEKFGAEDFPKRVRVQSLDDYLETAQSLDTDLLVVDEAHRVVTNAGFKSPHYERLAALAHASERLLLISATPVLGNETAMLALLHLLDPVTYGREDAASFSEKVRRRQEYGRLLLALRANAAEFRRRRAAAQMRDAFPEDKLIGELLPAFESSPDEDTREVAARAIRRHVAETYRLYQRLIRTRRRDLLDGELAARQGDVTVDLDTDPFVARLCVLLEDWRYRANLAGGNSKVIEHCLINRYVALFNALGASVSEFERELMKQRAAVKEGSQPTFADEAELVRAMREVLDERSRGMNRQRSARASSVRASLRPSVKVIAFTSFTDDAYQLQEELDRIGGWPEAATLLVARDTDRQHLRAELEAFRMSARAATLICDRTGEEGLNFHFADWLVHLDLPLSPSRLEQRVGRIDRYGRRQAGIKHRVVLPSTEPDSPWLAWKELLEEGFGLFTQSLSEVQFLLPTLQPEIERALFYEGAYGLRGLIATVNARLKEERDRLDEQHALDKMETDDGEDAPLIDGLKRADEDEASFATALDAWWSQGLQLDRAAEATRPGVFSLRWNPSTLVPAVPWRQLLKPGLDRPLTFGRAVAVHHPDVRLVRPGFPLIDRQQEYLRWDDRGTAFASWRRMHPWPLHGVSSWRGFRLCYLVEADLRAITDHILGRHDHEVTDRLTREEIERFLPSLRRRVDAILPPQVVTMYVGADDLRQVQDEALIDLLERPFTPFVLGQPCRDYNLGGRREALRSVISDAEFQDLCRDVRAGSEQMLRDNAAFVQQVEVAVKRAERLAHEQNVRLRRRHQAVFAEHGRDDVSLRKEIAMNEAILACAPYPRVRLDGLGFIVLSDVDPPAAVREAQ